MFQHIPYRYRIPVYISLIVVLTGILFTIFLGWQNYYDMQNNLLNKNRLLAEIYSKSMVEPLKHRDIWRAYSLIRSNPKASQNHNYINPVLIVILDKENKTFASTEPHQYPVGLEDQTLANFSCMEDNQAISTILKNKKVILISHIIFDGDSRLGQVLFVFPEEWYFSGVYHLAQRIGLITLLLLIILVPLGWLSGYRLSKPILCLDLCLTRLEREGPEAASCELPEGKGELGSVAKKLRGVLNQLVEKAALEKQMIAEERLAAIGRLSAGVAHEVNNPLSGMMTALDTFKHHSSDPLVVRETINLLERGLEQIRHTVSALLFQSRPKDRCFSHQDIEDIRSLLSSDLNRKKIQLTWHNELLDNVSLPSADVRQILINLLINAIQASPNKGHIIHCSRVINNNLNIDVYNDGEGITEEQHSFLFEPFSGFSDIGSGLGLWVTKQLTERMNGNITIKSQNDTIRFRVMIPLEDENIE